MDVLADPAVACLVLLNAAVLAWFVVAEVRWAMRAPASRIPAPPEDRTNEHEVRGGAEEPGGIDLPVAAVDCRNRGRNDRGERAGAGDRVGDTWHGN